MARANQRTLEEIEQLISGYDRSGLSRRQYCDQQNIAMTSLDYYRRRYQKQKPAPAPLVQVEIQGVQCSPAPERFSLILAKDRRIELTWNYSEPHLARLIRIVEAA